MIPRSSIPTPRVLLLLALLSGSALLPAQDWPQWRGADRDGKVTGFLVPEEWPKELHRQWKVDVGVGDATPALVGNRLYAIGRIDADEVVRCFDAATGTLIWEQKYPAEFVVTGPPARHPGPRSSPLVSNGRLCTLGVGGILSCFDATSGAVLWRKKSKEDYQGADYQFETAQSPIAVDGLCLVHVGGKDHGSVLAFDLATGKPTWKWDGENPSYASPVMMNLGGQKAVLFLAAKTLLAFNVKDGALLWQTPFSSGRGNNATPVVDGQTVYLTGQGKGLAAIRVEKKDGAWSVTNLWHNSQLGARFATPLLKDGLLYGCARNLFCADATNGETLWTADFREGDQASFIDAGPVILVLTVQSNLIALKSGESSYQELARYHVADSETWAHPVVSGKRIFIRDRDSVTLWELD